MGWSIGTTMKKRIVCLFSSAVCSAATFPPKVYCDNALAGLLARSAFNTFPFWITFIKTVVFIKSALELTAAGTAPELHRIPF